MAPSSKEKDAVAFTALDPKDREAIALLRQIFPDASYGELLAMHNNHVRKTAKRSDEQVQQQPADENKCLPTSKLGRRVWKEFLVETNRPDLQWIPRDLPQDFLRLPPEVAVRRHNPSQNTWEYQVVQTLEDQVVKLHKSHQASMKGSKQTDNFVLFESLEEACFTRVVFRHATNGLGMSLCEEGGRVWVHSLIGREGGRWFMAPPEKDEGNGGAALKAGILPGDWILGINGHALIPFPSVTPTNEKLLLRDAVTAIHYSPDPVVLHLLRLPSQRLHPLLERNSRAPSILLNSTALLDTTEETMDDVSSVSDEDCFKRHPVATQVEPQKPVPYVHPFVNSLADKGLMQSFEHQVNTTRELTMYTNRARQWETFLSFRVDSKTSELRIQFDPKDLPPEFTAESLSFIDHSVEAAPLYAPSTPTLEARLDEIPEKYLHSLGEPPAVDVNGSQLAMESRQTKSTTMGGRNRQGRLFPAMRAQQVSAERGIGPRREARQAETDLFIPLVGVRKGLSVRILNTFLDANRAAYTIWCYDIEAGREWYAPVRYLKDFQELRQACLPLLPNLAQVPFPTSSWAVFGSRDATDNESARNGKCRQLEYFLRALCSVIYRARLHPTIAEISIHVQSFLGCEVGLAEDLARKGASMELLLQSNVALNEAMGGPRAEEGHTDRQMRVRTLLKRAIQRYTFRLFLLKVVQQIVNKFVDLTRAQGPKLNDIESLEAKGRTVLKERGLQDLERIQAFMDQLQTLILDGCMTDFESIVERRDYLAIHPFMTGPRGKAYLEKVVREAVREQIEIEVYVPLRGVVSRLLVNGWRHDDMEIHFKMRELRKRQQGDFRIPPEKQSLSCWSSVASILNEGVGTSTLPCAKLRAIVDAANEIFRVFSIEHRDERTISTKQSLECDDSSVGKTSETTKEFTCVETAKAVLGAEDFLPIFIYCVVAADMERPCALCVLLQTLCEPTNRLGEVGYYLTSFESAITHIQETDLNDRS